MHEVEVRDLLKQPVETSNPPTQPMPNGQGDRPIANKAPVIAMRERNLYAFKNGKRIFEGSEPLHARGLEYFAFTGHKKSTIVGKKNAWSAAFVSFVMHKAGITHEQFQFAPNHATYIYQALENALDPNSTAPLKYHEAASFAPRVGDLVGYSSEGSVQSTKQIAARLATKKHFSSHTAVVVDVRPGELKLIGGNVGDTIGITTVATDSSGKILSSDKRFFVLAIDA